MDTRYRFSGVGDSPWGWWLCARNGRVHDSEGCSWSSVREAFWEGRLGMRSEHLAVEQQVLLMRVLGVVDAHWLRPSESRDDLFGGDMMFWRFYMCWLGSLGLLDLQPNNLGQRQSALSAALSAEGRAVLLMLRATSDPLWADLPMSELIEEVARANRDAADEVREAALREFERGIAPMPHLFARERAGRAHQVTLISLDFGSRMPVRRVVWSASFLDDRHRDDLFGWIAERVHRWEHWGEMAGLRGAKALTDHLLSLLVARPIRNGRAAGSCDYRS